MSDRIRMRFELEGTVAGDPSFPLNNFFTGRPPIFTRGRAFQIELVFLDNEIIDPNVSNISSVTFEVFTYLTPSSTRLISKTISVINATLTEDQREAATAQHAVINLDSGDTGLDMTGADASNNKNFSMAITGVRNGNLVSFSASTAIWYSDGGQYSGNTPTSGDATYLTAAQTLALIAGALNPANIILQPGGKITLPNAAATKAVDIFTDSDGTLQTPTGPYSP